MKPIIACLSVFLLFSCSRKNPSGADKTEVPSAAMADQKVGDKNEVIAERRIVKEGALLFETKDISSAGLYIEKSVKGLDGYISKDEINDYPDRTEQKIVVRIPPDKFDLLFSKAAEKADRIESKNINANDVTEEYIDINARVNTRKEVEDRYKALLRQATKVEDILTIEREIGRIREEIESVEGRLRYMDNRIALSTLTITFYQLRNSEFGFTSRFSQAVKNGWHNLLSFFIVITPFWPFILMTIIILYLIKKRNRSKQG